MDHSMDLITDPASLERLHDIVEPLPVSLIWPLAPGWWVLIILIVGAGIWIAVKWRRKWCANRYRRQALMVLQQTNDITRIPQILKRTALAAYPRESVASLYGTKWLAFLNDSTPEPLFVGDLGNILISLGYSTKRPTRLKCQNLMAAVRQWIISHRSLKEGFQKQEVQVTR